VVFATAAGAGQTSHGESPEPPAPIVITDPICAFEWTSCNPERMAAEAKVQAACGASRHFQGVRFDGPLKLGATWLRVGPRLGTMLLVTECKPTWTGANDPPRAFGRTHRIYRLLGISPRVALSLGGSSRRIMLARSVCEPPPTSDAALVRCLRRASR
jgi:hypothetical protein